MLERQRLMLEMSDEEIQAENDRYTEALNKAHLFTEEEREHVFKILGDKKVLGVNDKEKDDQEFTVQG